MPTTDKSLVNLGGGAAGIPNPAPGVLDDDEMVKANTGGAAIVGTGDTNTDLEVNFGSKNIVTTGVINSGTGTFRIGEAHDIGSGGENVTFTNLVDNHHFNPIWIDQGATEGSLRVAPEPLVEFTQEPSKLDVLVNPSWSSNPVVDWRVTQLTFEAETTVSNVTLSVTRNGKDFYRAKLETLTANVEVATDLFTSLNNVPVDAFAAGTYIISMASPDGDVRLKGSAANARPFFKVGYFAFEDLAINEFTKDEKSKLAALTGGRHLGIFADLAALQLAYPIGIEGDTATVTSPDGHLFYWSVSAWADSGTSSYGDMLKAVYDPSSKGASVYLMSSMDETLNAKILTPEERALIAASSTDVTLAVDSTTQEALALVGQELAVNQATLTTDGVMSSEDKLKLDNIYASGAINAEFIEINSDTDLSTDTNFMVDTTNNVVNINIPFGITRPFTVRDAFKKFNKTYSCIVHVKDIGGITVHTAELDKKDKGWVFYFNGTDWAYGEIGKGKILVVASDHTASVDFGVLNVAADDYTFEEIDGGIMYKAVENMVDDPRSLVSKYYVDNLPSGTSEYGELYTTITGTQKFDVPSPIIWDAAGVSSGITVSAGNVLAADDKITILSTGAHRVEFNGSAFIKKNETYGIYAYVNGSKAADLGSMLSIDDNITVPFPSSSRLLSLVAGDDVQIYVGCTGLKEFYLTPGTSFNVVKL